MYDLEWLEELRKRAEAIAEPIWETLLRDIVRRVRDAGAITSTAEYEIYRAEQLGLAEQAIKDAIAEQLQISNAAIDLLFEDLADETVLFEQNAELSQLVEAYSTVAKKAAAADFENLWAPGPDGKLYTVKEAYSQIMDFAFMQTATGTYDYQRAIREATRELLRRGLRTIPGKDNRSYRIEYAVRQYVQNRMGEMFNAISELNYEAIDADGWEISAHSAPAPDHAPYQGRQYSEEEYERINASLDRKFGWWNCAHLIYPIKLGVSPPAYTEEERQRYLDENEVGVEYDGLHYTLYEAKQRKRQLESMISQQKYEILAAEGDPKLLREQQIRLQNMRREYQRFCKETNQTPENWRTMVEGFGRSEASKAAWAARKLGLENYPSPRRQIRGILDAEKVFASSQDAQAAATLIDKGLNDYRLPPSTFSGKVILQNLPPTVLGQAEWNGDLSLQKNAGIDTIIHELLHMRSSNRYSPQDYIQNSCIEEATIELLTREICWEHGIRAELSDYDTMTNMLRRINHFTKTDKTDLEFAITLVNVPLKDRYDWLADEVERYIAKADPDEQTKGQLRNAVLTLYGGRRP